MRTKYFEEYMNTYCVLRTYARSTNYKPWSHHTTFCTPSILTNGSALCGEQYWLLFCPYVANRPMVCWSVIYPLSFISPKIIPNTTLCYFFMLAILRTLKSSTKKNYELAMQYKNDHNSIQPRLWTIHMIKKQ